MSMLGVTTCVVFGLALVSTQQPAWLQYIPAAADVAGGDADRLGDGRAPGAVAVFSGADAVA